MKGKSFELFIDGCVDRRVEFVAKRIVNAGYAGRNQEEVQKHIEELKKLGIPAPDKTPTYYPKPADLLTTADYLEVCDTENSGEAEYVLLVGEDEVYVAVGSDHTDRKLEETNILKAKQMYPNFMSRAVWRLEDVKGHWDELLLRAWIGSEQRELYQEARLAALLQPEDLLARVRELIQGKMAGTVIYSGTVAALGEGVRFSDYFECELLDEKRGQALRCRYTVKTMDWFQDKR